MRFNYEWTFTIPNLESLRYFKILMDSNPLESRRITIGNIGILSARTLRIAFTPQWKFRIGKKYL